MNHTHRPPGWPDDGPLSPDEVSRRFHLMRSLLGHRKRDVRLCELLALVADGATLEELIDLERAAG